MESLQRLGIAREQVWLHSPQDALQGEIVIVFLEAEHPSSLLSQLAASNLSFDRWLRQQMLELHGFDVAEALSSSPVELVFVWQKP
jgi:hypothetical protein